MNNHIILKLFRNTALTVALTTSVHLYAAPVVDQVIAVVGDSAILQSDLDYAMAAIQQQLEQNGQSVPPTPEFRKKVLDRLISRQAQLEQVKRLDIKPDEDELNSTLLKIANQQGVSSLEAFQQSLDQEQPGRYATLRAQVADDLSINRFRQQQVMARINVSDRDIDNFLKSPQGQAALGYQVRTLHVRIAPASSSTTADDVKEVATAVKQALTTTTDIETLNKQFSNDKVKIQSADMGLRPLSEIPADLAARISGLEVGQTTELIPAKDGIHVLKLLERQADDKKALVKQYLTRHILIQPSEVVSLSDAEQQINLIYKRLTIDNASFVEMASTYSSDPGSARNGGSLGWVSPGTMVPEFEQVMENAPVGQISQPFQTQYGWHILKVDATRDTDMTADLQRRLAKKLLAERQFDAEMDNWAHEMRTKTYIDIKDPSLKDDDKE